MRNFEKELKQLITDAYEQGYQLQAFDSNERCWKEVTAKIRMVQRVQGMALVYWTPHEDIEINSPHIIFKYPNRSKYEPVPDEVLKAVEGLIEYRKYGDSLVWYKESDDRYWYVYGEYDENGYDNGIQ